MPTVEHVFGSAWSALLGMVSGHSVLGLDVTAPILFSSVLLGVGAIPFFVVGGLYFLLEVLQIPFFEARRLQKRPRSPRDVATMLRVVRDVAVAQIVQLIPYLTFVLAPLAALRGLPYGRPLPSWTEIAVHVLVCALVNDFLFYWGHRVLHLPRFYNTLHKRHHEFKAPFAWSSEYASVFELLIVDTIPVFAGPLLLQSHALTFYIWVALRILYTLEIHSGYDLWLWRLVPFYGGAPMHDYHHKQFNGNYSDCFVFWDKLFGTWIEPPPLGQSDKQADGVPRSKQE